jgi:hypothetical protein
MAKIGKSKLLANFLVKLDGIFPQKKTFYKSALLEHLFPGIKKSKMVSLTSSLVITKNSIVLFNIFPTFNHVLVTSDLLVLT